MSLLFAKPKDNTTKKGEITESAILARLIQVGHQCLIPWGHVEDVPHAEAKLRLRETKNKQQKGIRWAKDYEI